MLPPLPELVESAPDPMMEEHRSNAARSDGTPIRPRQILPALLLAFACGAHPREKPEEPIFFPDPPDPPRIQFLRSIGQGSDLEPEAGWLERAIYGEDIRNQKRIRKPFGVTVHKGLFYVVDTGAVSILRIDIKRKKLEYIDIRGRAKLRYPMGMAFSEDGWIYVADREREQVVVLDEDFNYQKEFGPFGPDCAPIDVAVHDDRLYVVDSKATVLRILDRETGREIHQVGNDPDPDLYMRGPTFVSVDDNGYAYVSDTIYSRVYVWDRDGNFVRHIGKPGRVMGQFSRPKGLCVSGRTLWVVDAWYQSCIIFDFSGRPLLVFGGEGLAPGTMYLPSNIWVGEEGLDLFADYLAEDFVAEKLVIILNHYGPNKVSFYALGKSRDFEYPEDDFPEVPPKMEKSGPGEGEEGPSRRGPR